MLEALPDEWLIISIHTPARGVTQQVNDQQLRYRISIHTPARGVTYVVDDWVL